MHCFACVLIAFLFIIFITDTTETQSTPISDTLDTINEVDELLEEGETTTEISTSTLQQFKELIENMKTKFHDVNTSRNEKFQILTLLPKSWSLNVVQKHFQVSKYMFTLARELQNKNGIMSQPNLNHKGIVTIVDFKLAMSVKDI